VDLERGKKGASLVGLEKRGVWADVPHFLALERVEK